ncbi:MAG: type I-C CRISPR-associated protein Cas5c [Kiritimatiellae bacterium]|jgi:CRISPR-associated protein Cas5d|nr:type I-C CRISPR-associated protein Cas5c [Kiritimatiellia bacterium]
MTRMQSETFQVKITGDYACFTRPEMKVERVSYDVMTPSAARGVLEAILWKPAIQWRIHRIDVLSPIRWTSVRRNEVSTIASTSTAKSAMKKGSGNLGIYIEDTRQQRAGLFLKNVAYVVHATFSITENAGEGDSLVKFEQMFRRRVEKGQCFHRPYLGCREFPAEFTFSSGEETPIEESRPLGWMLLDIQFGEKENRPMFFSAEMVEGRIRIPDINSEEVRS